MSLEHRPNFIAMEFHDVFVFSIEPVSLQTSGLQFPAATLNHSDLFNAMIYPFTRTVVYGTIWYQGERLARFSQVLREPKIAVI